MIEDNICGCSSAIAVSVPKSQPLLSVLPNLHQLRNNSFETLLPGGGGGTPIYGLYVPRDRVWFLRFSILK